MSDRIHKLDPAQRAHEKQASREDDRRRLAEGQIDPSGLARENDFFAALDLPSFKIASIGRRRIGSGR